MNSMTGYGKGVAEKDGIKVTAELKSVNHRFLDLSFKLPGMYRFAEGIVRAVISSRFSRGHIDVFLNVEDAREGGGAVLNERLAADYLKIGKRLGEMGYVNDITAAVAVRVPDMVETALPDENDETLSAAIAEAAEKAAKALASMRFSEGNRLEADIKEKVASMRAVVREIELRAPDVVTEHRLKLEERVREALAGAEVDEARLLNEVAVYADRVAVDEEITRLKSHIENYFEIMAAEGPKGKKLDFLTQEAGREVNTIGSKCNDLYITKRVLTLKNIVETVREQVQNIE